jgi:multidrug resistance efflux pump
VRARLALLQAGSREEDITEARSRRDAAKGRVEEAAARLRYCSVDAPIDGIVLSINVSPGQLVSTTVPVTLLTIVDDSGRRVRSFVDEQNISKLCLRQSLRVVGDSVPGMQFDAVVRSIGLALSDNPFANNPSRQYRQVMLAVSNNGEQPPIGLRVSVQLSPCPAAQKPAGRQ